MNDRLRVAVVGTGEWWGREHARVFSRRADVELCAIVGRSHAKAVQRASEFATTPYVDLDAMLEAERPDLVSLCLPNEGHYDTTMRVIEAGYPLLVEKPLVFDLGEADRLLAAAAERGLFFAINFNHRYARPVEMARDAIASGALGQLTFATWRFGGEVGTSTHAVPVLRGWAGRPDHARRRPHLCLWRRGRARRHVRLFVRLPRHALRRSQRHRGASAGRRHG